MDRAPNSLQGISERQAFMELIMHMVGHIALENLPLKPATSRAPQSTSKTNP